MVEVDSLTVQLGSASLATPDSPDAPYGISSTFLLRASDENEVAKTIEIHVTQGVENIDISGWTFQNWDLAGSDITSKVAVYGSANDNIIASTSDTDLVRGGRGNDTILAGMGDDIVYGNKGKDNLSGGEGNDVLKGGKGRDILDGGAGDDTLIGGKGKDVFVFNADDGDDVIKGFKNGTDKLDLSGFGFATEAEAKSHFFEKGSDKNDVVGFEYDGTEIRIEGLDLRDINGADFII